MRWAVLALSLAGCTMVSPHTAPPSDWPSLQVIERRASLLEVQRACAPAGVPLAISALIGVYLGCFHISFERGTCEIWLIDSQEDDGVRLHELEHCQGRDHIGSRYLSDGWEAYKAAR